MNEDTQQIKKVIEGLLFAASEPVSIECLYRHLGDTYKNLSIKELRDAIAELANDCQNRGIELKEVASGLRFQIREELAPWISKLLAERPPRYSHALMEVLALIAYRQPITRAEIEAVRGVSVSTNIIRTLLEREWIDVVGNKDVPGRPELFATTKKFLDYFNLKNLADLPTIEEKPSEPL